MHDVRVDNLPQSWFHFSNLLMPKTSAFCVCYIYNFLINGHLLSFCVCVYWIYLIKGHDDNLLTVISFFFFLDQNYLDLDLFLLYHKGICFWKQFLLWKINDLSDENLNSALKIFNDLLSVSFVSFLLCHLHETCLMFSGFYGAALVQIVFVRQSSKRRRLESMKSLSFL